MRFLMKQLKYISDMVAESSVFLSRNSTESSQATNDIAKAIFDISEGAERQYRETSNAVESVSEMANNISEVVDHIEMVLSFAKKSAHKAMIGNENMQKSIEQMSKIAKSTNIVNEAVNEFDKKSKEISHMVDTISQIANQTNLLALNAAIEAARAGEYGRGFAVVADEVRKLAEESQIASNEIVAIISGINESNKRAVEAMTIGQQEIKTGQETIIQAGNDFSDVKTLSNDVSNKVHAISESIKKVSESGTMIKEKMTLINSISAKAATYSETVSATSEEQAASSEEIAELSQKLAYLSEEMHGAVNAYKVE
ncbi:MAG: methyl-accepting chemotaxis protein [Marinisporobacter sp.]|nr:methyl-accepting chemotaxis protein [Marinisporobacter sp.]